MPALRRTRLLLLLLPLLFLLLLHGCKKKNPEAATDEKPVVAVEATHPKFGPITEQIEADAILAPLAEAALSPRVTAPIQRFFVQRGSRVVAGQVVATLESSDLQAAALDNQGAFTAAKGAYTAATETTLPENETKARLDLEQARATLALDKSILNARSQLLSQGAIPGRDVDTAKATVLQSQTAYDLANQRYQALQKAGHSAALQSAKGTLESAQGKYLGAQAQLSYTSLRSPIRGVVTDRPLFPGETAPASTTLVTIMDTSSLIAKLHIAQSQAQQLALGSTATLTVNGLNASVPARVSLISPALDPGSTTVEVWLKVDNAAGRLRPGTAVHASLQGRTVAHALLVPTETVERSTEGPGKIVVILAADGTAKKRAITPGIETKASTQILGGLQPGDTVITSGGYGLDEGTKVKIEGARSKAGEKE